MADELAELVHEALDSALQLPASAVVANVDEIVNAFDEQQEFDVRLLSLTLNGDAWQPSPLDPTVADAVEEATRKLEIFSRPLTNRRACPRVCRRLKASSRSSCSSWIRLLQPQQCWRPSMVSRCPIWASSLSKVPRPRLVPTFG
jgi:hypothetical protein